MVVVTVVVVVGLVVIVVLVWVHSGMVSSTAAVRRIMKCYHQHSLVLPAGPRVYFNMLFEQRKHNTNQLAVCGCVGCPACFSCFYSCSVSFAVVNAIADFALEVRAVAVLVVCCCGCPLALFL